MDYSPGGEQMAAARAALGLTAVEQSPPEQPQKEATANG
jgi:hypothetical protein